MTILIIGGGQAAMQTIISLRQGGCDMPITLLGNEPHLPYQRPPLSKQYLTGAMAAERLFFKPKSFFTEQNINLRLGETATQIDLAARRVTTDAGAQLDYAQLVLATGSRPKKLALANAELTNIFTLRGIDDIDAIRPHCAAGKRLVIIGGGYIGLEAAAACRTLGCAVTIIETAPRVLARVTHPDMSDYFARLHAEKGVEILTEARLTHFDGAQGKTAHVCLADGRALPADVVIIGVGITPNVELAAAAGLAIDADSGGIIVDDCARTKDAHVYAAGDCTAHPNPLLARRLRLESVPNAIAQGKAAAAAILGAPKPYHEIPWFWSDQFDVKLQIAGLSDGATHTVQRGDMAQHSFALFYFKDTQLIAIDAVNRAAEFMAARQLIAAAAKGFVQSPKILADENSKPKDWLAALKAG